MILIYLYKIKVDTLLLNHLMSYNISFAQIKI